MEISFNFAFFMNAYGSAIKYIFVLGIALVSYVVKLKQPLYGCIYSLPKVRRQGRHHGVLSERGNQTQWWTLNSTSPCAESNRKGRTKCLVHYSKTIIFLQVEITLLFHYWLHYCYCLHYWSHFKISSWTLRQFQRAWGPSAPASLSNFGAT